MLFGCEQPFLWGERCVTSLKMDAKETIETHTKPKPKDCAAFVTSVTYYLDGFEIEWLADIIRTTL